MEARQAREDRRVGRIAGHVARRLGLVPRRLPEEAADRLIAMLCYAAEERPEWLQVEQPVAGAFLSRPRRDRTADP